MVTSTSRLNYNPNLQTRPKELDCVCVLPSSLMGAKKLYMKPRKMLSKVRSWQWSSDPNCLICKGSGVIPTPQGGS